jgi:hypothetical protein
MFDTPKLYISACSNSCQLVPLHPIVISILFHNYKEPKECISGVERIVANVKRLLLLVKKEKMGNPAMLPLGGATTTVTSSTRL